MNSRNSSLYFVNVKQIEQFQEKTYLLLLATYTTFNISWVDIDRDGQINLFELKLKEVK
jgi:hypothetical protein